MKTFSLPFCELPMHAQAPVYLTEKTDEDLDIHLVIWISNQSAEEDH